MKKAVVYAMLAAGLLTITGMFATSAFAHEGRRYLPYVVFVGFRNEPAFEDEANALDFFVLYDTDGNGECADEVCSDWIPVDRGNGDTVDIEAKVLYLEDDDFNADVLASAKLEGELDQDFGDPSRYNIFFKPNVDGAYGFKIRGTIQRAGVDPFEISGDAGKFVCGEGTQEPGDDFSCVADILQPFPLNSQASYRNNPPLGGSGHHGGGHGHHGHRGRR